MSQSAPDVPEKDLKILFSILALILSENEHESAAALGKIRQMASEDEVTAGALRLAMENVIRQKPNPFEENGTEKERQKTRKRISKLNREISSLMRTISSNDEKAATMIYEMHVFKSAFIIADRRRRTWKCLTIAASSIALPLLLLFSFLLSH